jgi:hypothetical protein
LKYATTESDRVAVVASKLFSVGTLIIAVMIMISTFACNNGLIMAVLGFIIRWLRMVCFKESGPTE